MKFWYFMTCFSTHVGIFWNLLQWSLQLLSLCLSSVAIFCDHCVRYSIQVCCCMCCKYLPRFLSIWCLGHHFFCKKSEVQEMSIARQETLKMSYKSSNKFRNFKVKKKKRKKNNNNTNKNMSIRNAVKLLLRS